MFEIVFCCYGKKHSDQSQSVEVLFDVHFQITSIVEESQGRHSNRKLKAEIIAHADLITSLNFVVSYQIQDHLSR